MEVCYFHSRPSSLCFSYDCLARPSAVLEFKDLCVSNNMAPKFKPSKSFLWSSTKDTRFGLILKEKLDELVFLTNWYVSNAKKILSIHSSYAQCWPQTLTITTGPQVIWSPTTRSPSRFRHVSWCSISECDRHQIKSNLT